jgi:anti-sigma factor RsiW
MVAHISTKDIGRYADGEVGQEEALRLGHHLSDCPYCRERLAAERRLTGDLKAYFAMPLPAGASASPRSRTAWQPLRVPAAAAAVLAAILAYPAVSSEFAPPPTTGASTVMPFAIGERVSGEPSWSQLSTWYGFVVERYDGSLEVRSGASLLRVELPPGADASQYPVGSAVMVRGSLAGHGVVSAAAVQQITP